MYDNKELMHRFAKVGCMAMGGHGHHGPEGPRHCCHRGPEGPAPEGGHHGPHGRCHGRGPSGPMSPMRGQGRILAALADRDGLTTRDLVELLDVRPSSLNESLGRLEARGLVGRSQSQADGRQVEVRMAERDPSSMFDCLTDEEREQLGALLDKVIASVKEARTDPERGTA